MNKNLKELLETTRHPLTEKTISQGPCLYQTLDNGYFISVVDNPEQGYNVFLWNEFLGVIALVAFEVPKEEVDVTIDSFQEKSNTLSMDDFMDLDAQVNQ